MNSGQLAYQESFEEKATNRLSESQLMRQYLPLVKRSVSQLRSHCGAALAIEDMEQIGMMALLESSRRYPGEFDNGFISFAGQRIRGAILDELRRQDWRPRPVRQQAHELNDSVRKLTRKLGRDPTDIEVADSMGINREQYRDRLYASQSESMKSLDDMLSAGSHFSDNVNAIEQFSSKQTLMKAISKLNKREQVILSLYYQHELNLKEIAGTLGLTETRICQLHKLAVKHLQEIYQQWER
ncbi:RNA polymerase sigma factor FliA [Shewanella eurypsychrophilus]|uniref:RNA polymerase sigma factor FliA n=1 Tax=Shewanella eurypsychrophilus TaxID=2593656 RepID=A0ABX6V093_9GAMM|nr:MULTISPECIES: RNA polymerase sigma factor FliA [Shewanella]QFU20462.1 FliA/WhiG family RNA polymerase sigma factor [Shewanella sp. YLB-09]QFU20744.1 FliA/WhiG family RNA polymerase sigma factor [Shewanella sp. YLB-09]QPG56039.1 RNA polymerase sigma factor FliA [Shewanella eurypsychrophilus]